MPSEPKPVAPKLRTPVILVVALAAAGLGLWVAQRGSSPPPPLPDAPAAATASRKAGETSTLPEAQLSSPEPSSSLPPPTATKQDEEKIYAWLTGFDDPNRVAEAILAGWPGLSEGGRTAAAPHLLNLVSDEHFGSVAEIMLHPRTSTEVKDILFAGVLNRPDAVKWPLILKVMEQTDHPHSRDARNILSVVLGGDYGDDWNRWRSLVATRLLKQSPP